MIPFAFFGVDYCSGSSGGVGGSRQDSTAAKITEAEFAQAIRDQQEQLRRSAQGVDPAILDNPEVRFNLGCSRLLREQARRERRAATSHFRVSNRGLRPHRGGPALSRGRALLARSSTRTCCGRRGHRPSPRSRTASGVGSSPSRIVDPHRARAASSAQSPAVDVQVQPRRAAARRSSIAQHRRRDVRQGRQRVDAAQEKAFYDANAAAFRDARGGEVRVRGADARMRCSQVAVTPEEVRGAIRPARPRPTARKSSGRRRTS